MMQEAKKSYHRGLEFYYTPSMGLCGIENDKDGHQSTYQYLSAHEAADWVAAWIDGVRWNRQPGYEHERAHA